MPAATHIMGLDIGDTTGTGFGITDSGGNVGTLTIQDVAITGTGSAIEIDNGGTLAILTEGDTPYDDLAHIRLRGSAGDELVAVLDHLDTPG